MVVVLSFVVALGHNKAKPKYKPGVVTRSTDRPSEEPIKKATYKSKAGPTEPKYIKLPSVSIEGFVEKVGVDQNNQVAVPTNIYLAGWFVDMAKPGDNGLSIIDGHVDGYRYDGIFKNLPNIKIGAKFDVVRGDDSVLHYVVRNIDTIDTDKAAATLFSQDPKMKSQLNLITCGGTFDKAKKQYDKRVIVESELLK